MRKHLVASFVSGARRPWWLAWASRRWPRRPPPGPSPRAGAFTTAGVAHHTHFTDTTTGADFLCEGLKMAGTTGPAD
jgi:hypothetical protein